MTLQPFPRHSLWAGAAAGLLALGLVACTSGNANSQDQAIDQAVQNKLNADPALQGAGIQASALNGVVTLTGTTTSDAARNAAGQDAQVPGVTQVNNQIATNSAANPAAGAAAAATAPTTSEPAPPPAAPAASAMTAAAPVEIEAGTPLHVRLDEGLDSATASTGQSFRATVTQPVLVNGQVAIPRGAEVNGRVTAVDAAGHFKGQSRLVIALDRLRCNGQSYGLSTHEITRLAASRSTRSTEAIGGGAAVGALIGALAGHGKGAAIGAISGAGAGTAAQAMTKPAEVDLPAETVLRFTLAHPIQVVPQ